MKNWISTAEKSKKCNIEKLSKNSLEALILGSFKYFFQHEWTRLYVGREGGWVGVEQKGPSIFLIIRYSNQQDELIPDLASKIVYGF